MQLKLSKQNQIVRSLVKENVQLKETLELIPKDANTFDFQILKTKILDLHKDSVKKRGDVDRFLKGLGNGKGQERYTSGTISGFGTGKRVLELEKELQTKEKVITAYRDKMKTLVGLGYQRLGKTSAF